MAKLIYFINMSLDGYIADDAGDFGFTEPSDEVHRFINDLVRPIGTYLMGRRMYEVMSYWETPPTDVFQSETTSDFAKIWNDLDKIVYSATLSEISTKRTRLEREFRADDVRDIKERSTANLTIAGPNLAAHAIEAGLVDEMHFMVTPYVIGSGNRAIPSRRLDLSLIEQRSFDNGAVYLRYEIKK